VLGISTQRDVDSTSNAANDSIVFTPMAQKKDAEPSLLLSAPAKGHQRTALGQRPLRGAAQVAASLVFEPKLNWRF
jgi:hypothetical protein